MVTKQEYDEAGQVGARREAYKEGSHVTADMVEDACQGLAKAHGSDQYPGGKFKDYWVSRPLIRAALESVIPPPAADAIRWELRSLRNGAWMEWRLCTRKEHDEIRAGEWDNPNAGRLYEARALYLHPPTHPPASVAVTEATIEAAWRAATPIEGETGGAAFRRGIEAAIRHHALSQGGKP